jgi:hypothetical protein
MAYNYRQGFWKPKNPEKYIGDVNQIFYRSGWELKFLNFADMNPQVLKYGSEELAIPYFSEVDKKMHRYFPDFLMIVQNNSGQVKKYMVEIKPHKERFIPKRPSKITKRYITEMKTYSVNQSKWRAAEAFCAKQNIEFIVMDEYSLGIARKKKVAS